MSLYDEDTKVMGGIAGATGGACTGVQAAAIIAPFTGPFAPLVILGGLLAGSVLGGSVGYRDPAAGALAGLGVVTGLPVPTPGNEGS